MPSSSRYSRRGPASSFRGGKIALVVALGVLAMAVAVSIASTARATGSVCSTSGPASGAYAATVCITNPADGASLTGAMPVSVTVSVTGTNPGIRSLAFYLPGEALDDLLVDFASPYEFTLPTTKWVDGARTIQVEAEMRDGFVSQRAEVGVTFDNGITEPPVNGNTFTPSLGTTPSPGEPFVLATTGDGAGGEPSADAVNDLAASWNPNLFLYTGDVYEHGTSTEFYNWYGHDGSFFERFRSITNPAIGNHEYENDGAPGYYDYWDNVPDYYSYTAAGWHFISLNSTAQFGQTAPGSPQYEWLAEDLADNTAPCTVAYFHHPVYNIGPEGSATRMDEIWALMAQNGVDIVLTSHDHDYQLWSALNGAGELDPNGVTQLVVGTGGHSLQQFVRSDSRVANAIGGQFGALRMELNPQGAAYQFVSTNRITLDSGSIPCREADADTTPPTAPQELDANAISRSQIDLNWRVAADNVGVTEYEIYRNGSLLTTIGPQRTYSDATVAPEGTYQYEVRARDGAGNVSPPSNVATATTPADVVLFSSTFESGNMSRWTNSTGLVVQQNEVFSGQWSARGTSTGAAAYAYKQLTAGHNELYYRLRFKIVSQGSNAVNLLRFKTATNGKILSAFLSSTGKLGYRNDVTGVTTTSTTVASRSVWHTLKIRVLVNGAAGQSETWLDGIRINALSKTESLGTTPMSRIELGESSTLRTFDVAFDEIAVDPAFIGDTIAPSIPEDLVATPASGLAVDLSWTASTDDTAVAGYDIFRDGTLLSSVGTVTSYRDATVSPLSSHVYEVQARDTADNISDLSDPATANTPFVFEDGFGSGNLSAWTFSTGLVVQEAFSPGSGSAYVARATTTGAAAYAYESLDVAQPELYYRLRFKLLSRGANSVNLLRFRTPTGSSLWSLMVNSSGKLAARNDVTATTTTSTVVVNTGVWYEIQAHLVVNGSSGQAEVWLAGAPVAALSRAEALGSTPIGRVQLGDSSTGRTYDAMFDEILVNTSFVPDTTQPTAPTDVTATAAGMNQVDVAWTAATDNIAVTGYEIYRNGSLLTTVGTEASFTDTTVSPGTTYEYELRAFDAAENGSPASNVAVATTTGPDTQPPTTPTGLSATAVSSTRIDLGWTASTDNVGVTGYRIYRDGSLLTTVGPSPTTYSDTTVTQSTTYTYTASAIDAMTNESLQSDPASATTPTPDTEPPTTPTSLGATAVSTAQIDLGWTDSTDNVGVTGYRIYRDGSLLTTVGPTPTSYSDTTVAHSTTYTYTVSAIDAANNESPQSDPASATTPHAVLFQDDFESGNFAAWTTSTGMTAQQSEVFGGLWAVRADASGAAAYAVKQLGSAQSELYYRLRFKILSQGANTMNLLKFRTAADSSLLGAYVSSTGKLGERNDFTGISTTSSTVVSAGTWHQLQIHVVVAGVLSLTEVWLDGTQISALTKTDSLGTTPVGRIHLGDNASGRTFSVAFDDVVVDTQ
ncbi:MAG: Ig-like domain-containing protein [Actinomycetota bacterium]